MVGLIEQLCNELFGGTHEVVRVVLHERGKLERIGHYLVIDFLHVVSVHLYEGILPCQQLV